MFKHYITSRGLFYVLVCALLGLFIALLRLFDPILVWGQMAAWEGILTPASGLMPEIGLSFAVDSLSFCFLLLVVTIGLGTNIYALNYFKYEANEDSFILLLNWFILSMLCLLLANNLFTLFLGWELIGLTSFFLINFWSERRGTLKSSFKAFVFNKVSDAFLFIFIILVWFVTSESNLVSINLKLSLTTTLHTPNYYYICAFSLIFCSSIKSAQIFGHLWLPDSMEAPVPASALIHSATLVSAGLYLLLRFNSLITLLNLQIIMIYLGAITAAYGGIVASAQTDVKKLLAYSTISHCGFLYVCAGFQCYYLVIIYLFLHGVFKALTFFCVGSFIRVAGSQDTRQMGALSRYLPVDTIFLIFCASNLGGLPFTLGSLYKHIFVLSLVNSTHGFLIVGLCFVGMLTSLVYVFRLVYYSAFDISKGSVGLQLKELQLNTSLLKNYWSATTIVQSIAVFLLLFIILYFYLCFFELMSLSGVTNTHYPLSLYSDPSYFKQVESFYAFYLNFFYTLYVLVASIILIVECRRAHSWVYKIYFIIYLLSFTFLCVIILTV